MALSSFNDLCIFWTQYRWDTLTAAKVHLILPSFTEFFRPSFTSWLLDFTWSRMITARTFLLLPIGSSMTVPSLHQRLTEFSFITDELLSGVHLRGLVQHVDESVERVPVGHQRPRRVARGPQTSARPRRGTSSTCVTEFLPSFWVFLGFRLIISLRFSPTAARFGPIQILQRCRGRRRGRCRGRRGRKGLKGLGLKTVSCCCNNIDWKLADGTAFRTDIFQAPPNAAPDWLPLLTNQGSRCIWLEVHFERRP